MTRIIPFKRRPKPREILDGPHSDVLKVVRVEMAQQAMREVCGLLPGQRLIVECNEDQRTPWTIIVEHMDAPAA